MLTEGNSLLGEEELELLIILRMNRDFMVFMREHYSHLVKEPFGRTVVKDGREVVDLSRRFHISDPFILSSISFRSERSRLGTAPWHGIP